MSTPPEPSVQIGGAYVDPLWHENQQLRDRLALAEAERDRLGVLDTVLKERRHHPDCPYKRECNCWLAAALTHRHDADLERLALAEQNNEQLTAERDEFRQMARFSQHDEEAMDIIHRAADLLRPDVDMATRLALAEQALADAGLREDRLRAVAEAARGYHAAYWSDEQVIENEARAELGTALTRLTTPTQQAAVTQAVHSAAEPRFTVNPLRCAEISPRRLSHP